MIIKCKSLIIKVYIPSFIGKQMMSLKWNCKYINQTWLEWKSQLGMNFKLNWIFNLIKNKILKY